MRTQRGNAAVSAFLRTPISVAVALAFAQGANAVTYTVTNANSSGAGSLYQAISDANTNCATDTAPVIQFSGPFVISPSFTLPPFPQFYCPSASPYNPTIDAWSTPTATQNTDATGFNATLPVVVNMSSFMYGGYCVFDYSGNGYGGSLTMKGMEVRDYTYGGNAACGTLTLQGNRFTNVVNDAVRVYSGSSVGGAALADRNVIANNAYGAGISLGSGGDYNVVNNLIGTLDGVTGAPNEQGVVSSSSCCTTMSGSISSNIIVSNYRNIFLVGDTFTISNNRIGTDASGTSLLGAGSYGISLNYSYGSQITGNVIAGQGTAIDNGSSGFFGGSGNVYISGNTIGNTIGNSELGNAVGIYDSYAYGTRIENNVISGNSDTAIQLGNSSYSTIVSNMIGTDAGGNTAMRNDFGIFAVDSDHTLVDSNTISGNYVGVALDGAYLTTLQNNRIGLKSSATAALPNDNGVWMDCSYDLTVANNTISGNMYGGLQLAAVQTSNFNGNTIGGSVPNGGNGVDMYGITCGGGAKLASAKRTVGGDTRAKRMAAKVTFDGFTYNEPDTNNFSDNTISNNTGMGVILVGGSGNTFFDNHINSNGMDGLLIQSHCCDTYGGNIADATGNAIVQNLIYGNGQKNISLDFPGGPLPNDAGDVDNKRPNNWQNYPVLTGAIHDTVNNWTTIGFTLDSNFPGDFRIDFFANPSPGTPAGQTYLGNTFLSVPASPSPNPPSGSYSVNGVTWDNISAVATRIGPESPAVQDSSEFSPEVTASGLPVPAVNIVPTSVDFGDVVVGRSSSAATISVMSQGTADYVINALRDATCTGPAICSTGAFVCSTTCAEGTPYRPGQSCAITASFAPTAVGSQSKILAVCDNTGTNKSLLLTGNGVPAPNVDIAFTPSFFSFGEVLVGAQSPAHSFTLKNSGATQVYLGPVSTTGDFVITGSTCGPTLVGGASCDTDVAFAPSTKGGQNGSVQVTGSNTPMSPAAARSKVTSASTTVASSLLQGSGAQFGDLRLPASITFGTLVLHSDPGTQILQLDNTGNGPLAVSSITVSGPFTMTNDCGTSLAVGASCTISLKFNPSALGSFSGTLTVVTDAPGGSRAIALSAEVIADARPVVRTNPVTMGFGERLIGSASTASRVTVTNEGAQVAALGTMTFVQPETGKSEYSISATNCPASLAAQASCFVDVVFTPLGFGTRDGQLVVPSNSVDSPRTVTLGGTGCRPFVAGRNRSNRDPCAP